MNAEANDRRRKRGFDPSKPLGSFVEVTRGVLIEPARFFAGLGESREQGEGSGRPLLFAGIWFAIGLFLTYLAEPLDPLSPQDAPNPLYEFFTVAQSNPPAVLIAILLAFVLVPIGALITVYLFAVILHLFVLAFVRERRDFWATLLVVAYGIQATSLVAWIPVLGYLAGPYSAYVAAVGLREMHGTTTVRALLVVLVPYLLPVVWGLYIVFL